MKRILLVLVVSSLLVLAQAAHAVYLDSSWHANLTNVRTYGANYSLDPFWGMVSSSTHITAASGSGTASFTIPQSGQATIGENASWGNTTLAEPNTVGSLSFDYTTFWTQPNLVLSVEEFELAAVGPPAVVWSSSRTGLRSGHVTIDADPNGYWFRVTVVPEPGGLCCLGALCMAGSLRRRSTAQRKPAGP